MQHPRRTPLVAAVFATFAALCVLAAIADARTTSRVRSNLDQKTTLPSRILWNAYPSAPSSRIKEVDFLIDGTTRWIEQHPPYGYADGDGLVTTWQAQAHTASRFGRSRRAAREVQTSSRRACYPHLLPLPR